MKTSILAIVLCALLGAPAAATTIAITPLVVAQQTTLPTLVTTCASPNAPAHVSGDAFYQVPTIAVQQGIAGTATVKIALNANGGLISHEIFASSGNPWLDQAALQSARMTRFNAETRNCERVAGTYLYAVQFNAAAGS